MEHSGTQTDNSIDIPNIIINNDLSLKIYLDQQIIIIQIIDVFDVIDVIIIIEIINNIITIGEIICLHNFLSK